MTFRIAIVQPITNPIGEDERNIADAVGFIIRAKAEFIPMPVASKNPLDIYSNVGRIRRLIHAWNVDIVHVRSRAPAWSA